MTGRVVKLLSGVYSVETPSGSYLCRAKGSFRVQGVSPVPGDMVEITAFPDRSGRIEQILPRTNRLIRPNVANVDVLCYVSSVSHPAPFPFTIDKMLVIAQAQGITPILVFNKVDLPDPDGAGALAALYARIGCRVYCVSAASGEGIDRLREGLAGKIVVFAGNSGVGKSSLLNAMYPALSLATGEISEKLGRGRHTTRHIELFHAGGALIGDTPGFGALELDGYSIKRTDLAGYFPEFQPFLSECPYSDCAHLDEQDCAVRKAAAEGHIAPSRYESYRQIYQILKEDESPWSKKQKN